MALCALNPPKKTRREQPQLKEMNLRNEWSKEFLSAASSIKIKDFVCRWSWLWLICPAALSLLSLIPPLACLYFSSQRVKGCSERESWLKWKDSWSVGWSLSWRYSIDLNKARRMEWNQIERFDEMEFRRCKRGRWPITRNQTNSAPTPFINQRIPLSFIHLIYSFDWAPLVLAALELMKRLL